MPLYIIKKGGKTTFMKEKLLHGKFFRKIYGIWKWIQEGFMKKETEGLLLAGEEQALRTN